MRTLFRPRVAARTLARVAALAAAAVAAAACGDDRRDGAPTTPGVAAVPRTIARAMPADLPPMIAASIQDAESAGLIPCGTSPDVPGASFSRVGAPTGGALHSVAEFGGGAGGATLTSTTGFPVLDLAALGNRQTYPTAANDAGQVVGASLNADAVNYTAFAWTKGTGYTLIAPLAGGVTSYALGNNASGEAVGYSRASTGATRAFLWSGGSASDLGAAFGGDSTVAYDLTDGGVVVGHGKVAGVPHPFRYQGGTFTDLGLPSGLARAYGTAISGDGQTLAGWGTTSANSSRAWRWANGVFTVAALPAGVTQARAFGVNAAGDVVGFAVTTAGIRGFFWAANGTFTLIGTLPSGGESRLWAINDAGVATGYSRSQNDGFLAIRYSLAGGLVNLGKQQGACSSYGYAITTDGDVVGNNDMSQILHGGVWPTPAAGLPPVTDTEGKEVTFNATVDGLCTAGAVTYRWDFGDGSPVVETTTPNVTHTYADNRPNNAPYPVTLLVTDACGNRKTVTSTATIVNVPPAPTVSPVKATLGCTEAGQVTWSFTDAGVNDTPWAWTITWDDGASDDGEAPAQGGPFTSPTHTYTASGTYTVTLTVTDKDGASNSATAQITYACAPRFSLGDRVWLDADGDGTQDGGEPGVDGVTLAVSGPNGYTGGATTGNGGLYTVENLLAGDYTVCVAAPNLATGGALAGRIPTFDADGVVTPNCATVSVGPNRTDVDFGYTAPRYSLGDRVWLDANGNGAQDGGEASVANVGLTISGPNGYTATASTGTDGLYSFGDLLAGSYTVCVAADNFDTGMPLAGLVQTYDVDGAATANCATVTLASNRTDVDFGYKTSPKFSLGDRVWYDADADGKQDTNEPGLKSVTLTLQSSTGATLGTTVTDGHGNYTFGNLAAGTYKVCVTGGLPSWAYQTYDLDGTATKNCATVALGASRTDVDFGYDCPPSSTGQGLLGDQAWIDANGNGRQDAGEPVLPWVKVVLSGAASGYEYTDRYGKYDFAGLRAGTYTVTAYAPSGFAFTTANAAGVAADKNSNGNPTTVSFTTATFADRTIDFGFVPKPQTGKCVEGCKADFWKQSQYVGYWKWYGQHDKVDSVFGVKYLASATLLGAVSTTSSSASAQLFRQGTAALLNAVYKSGVDFPYTAPQVLAMVRDAHNSGSGAKIAEVTYKLAAANAQGCPLGRR